MRTYAEMVAMEIRERTGLQAQVNTKQMPDGTERFGVTVKETSANIAPSIYVDEMKGAGLTVEQAATEVLKLYETHKNPKVDVDWFTHFEQVKEKLYVKMLPKTFKTDVYRSAKAYGFEDLILVPYVRAELTPGEFGSIRVSADHIEKWGVTKREVMDTAIKNTKNGNVKVISLMAFMTGFAGFDGYNEETSYDEPFVISNSEAVFGASAILGKIKDIKAENPDGFYVIPSSVHELIVLPKGINGMDEEMITGFVHEVNSQVVVPEERLSDHVYTF